MKRVIGPIILFLVVTLVTLLVLYIWGVQVFSEYALLQSWATLVVLMGATVLLLIIWFATYQNPVAGYNPQSGHRAQRKQLGHELRREQTSA